MLCPPLYLTGIHRCLVIQSVFERSYALLHWRGNCRSVYVRSTAMVVLFKTTIQVAQILEWSYLKDVQAIVIQ